MNPQMLTESARRCLGALRKKCFDGLAQRDVRRRGCFAGGIQRKTTAIGVPRSGPSRLDCSASGLGACRLELPSIQAALGRTIQAALGRTIQAWQSPPTTSLSDRRNPQPRKLATIASSSLQQEQEDEKAEGRRRGRNNMKE